MIATTAPLLPPFPASAPAGPIELDLTEVAGVDAQLAAIRDSPATAIALPVGLAFYAEVAKFRAARYVANRPLYLKAVPSPRLNQIQLTLAALAARLGRADTTVLVNETLAPHLAANIEHILTEECQLPEDPAAGSYFIDSLTHQLAGLEPGEGRAAGPRAGSGLGLAICREIVAAAGGRLALDERHPGPGLAARAWLPAAPGTPR